REHGTGRLRRVRHTDHCAARRNLDRCAAAECNGWPPAADLLAHRAILVDLGVCGISPDDRDLARAARGGCWLRCAAVPRLQLSRSVARRYRRVGNIDGMPHRVPARLATEPASR